MILQGRLNGKQHNRLKRLLDMMYKPSELAEEIGIDVNQVYRVYLDMGCPHERDRRKHYWINGKAFYEWYDNTYKKLKLMPGEAYCKTCNKAVKMVNPVQKQKGGLIYDLSNCPHCNRKLTRIITQKRDND